MESEATGLGAGQAQWGWVPEAHTDLVFAVIGEQLGFVGALAVLVLLGTIVFTGFRTAQVAPDVFGALLAAGISLWFLVSGSGQFIWGLEAVTHNWGYVAICLLWRYLANNQLASCGLTSQHSASITMKILTSSGPLCVRGGVLISGGGTAGHLLPGLAVAEELVNRGCKRNEIAFVGSARGVEVSMVPAAGFRLRALSGRGLNGRRISLPNLWNLLAILWGVLRGIFVVGRCRPGIVLSLGGYAALPASVGAILFRVPLVLAEQNSAASGVNRLLTKYAKAAAVPHSGTGLRNEVVTGNPVRESVIEADRLGRSSRSELQWPSEDPVVVVFGGSLGSRRINEAIWQASSHSDLPLIYHVVGERDWHMLPVDLPNKIKAIPYDKELPKAMAAADLIVCRPRRVNRCRNFFVGSSGHSRALAPSPK